MLTILAVREVSHCARSSVATRWGTPCCPLTIPDPLLYLAVALQRRANLANPKFYTKIVDFYIFIFNNNFLNVQTFKNSTYINNSHHTFPLEKLRSWTGTAVVAAPA